MTRFAVIGAGLTGAAAAWQLARTGHEVTVLERDRPASAHGSSHGSARIFRYAYPDLFYARMVGRARREWDELEALARCRLIAPADSLDFGAVRDIRRIAATLAAAGVEHEYLSRAQARGRWPQIAFDTDVVLHAAAGVIDSERSVNAMIALAQADGAELQAGWAVAAVERVGDGFLTTAEDGRIVEADGVVVAVGGWLPDLLGSLGLGAGVLAAVPPLDVSEEIAYHFPYAGDMAGPPWPTFIHKAESIQVYSLPGGRDSLRADGSTGQKLAIYNGGASIGSAARRTGAIDPANRARAIEYVREFVPGLAPEPYAETTCLFTRTPGEDFIIDTIDGITIASPCSGHGAKFAPLLGRFVAASALGTPAPRRFRLAGA
jgi:sarcosine oxidase